MENWLSVILFLAAVTAMIAFGGMGGFSRSEIAVARYVLYFFLVLLSGSIVMLALGHHQRRR
jgi:hypothetical protein